MKMEKDFAVIEQEYLKTLDAIKQHASKEKIRKQWENVTEQFQNSQSVILKTMTSDTRKKMVQESFAHSQEYMRRLVACLFRDCHPAQYPDWKAVNPNDEKWKLYYVPLCISDCRRDMAWIDKLVTVDIKEQKAKKNHQHV